MSAISAAAPLPVQQLPVQQSSQANQMLFDSVSILRRRLRSELSTLRTQITQSGAQDELSTLLLNWINRFEGSLGNQNLDDTKNRFIELLKEILVDPFNVPLDEDAVLGNDGHTYGKKNLVLYFNMVEAAIRNRSPLNPNDATVFTVDSHPHVRRMIDWIRTHSTYVTSAVVTNRYQALQTSQLRVFTYEDIRQSNPNRERIRLQIIRVRERNLTLNANVAAVQQQYTALSAQISETFSFVDLRTTQFAQSTLNQLQNIENEMTQQNNQLSQAIQTLDNEISQLEKQSQDLQSQIKNTQTNLTQAQKESKELEQNIIDVQTEIKKRKRNNLKKVLKVAAIIGVCILATWALGSLAAAAGSSAKMAVLPVKSGAKFLVSKPF